MGIVGAWKLTLETPFGTQTPTLRIEADGTGGLMSPIGEAPLSDLQLTEDTAEFNASVPTPWAICRSASASRPAATRWPASSHHRSALLISPAFGRLEISSVSSIKAAMRSRVG